MTEQCNLLLPVNVEEQPREECIACRPMELVVSVFRFIDRSRRKHTICELGYKLFAVPAIAASIHMTNCVRVPVKKKGSAFSHSFICRGTVAVVIGVQRQVLVIQRVPKTVEVPLDHHMDSIVLVTFVLQTKYQAFTQ